MAKKTPRNIALVLFGGSGKRFGGKLPKQFVSVNGKPLLCYPLEVLQRNPDVRDVYVIAMKGTEAITSEIIAEHHFHKVRFVIPGGSTRQESVAIGLERLKHEGIDGETLIAICDGDRPNLTDDLIRRNYEAAMKTGAAVTAVRATDSILYAAKGSTVDAYLPRSSIYLAQTPQTFRFDLICKAHEKGKKIQGTDDASLVKALGKKVAIVEGSRSNLKITTKEDLVVFEAGLQR